MTHTIVHRTPLDAAQGEASGLRPLPFSEGLYRTAGSSGAFQSPVIEAPAPFDDLVGSWNADVPKDAALEMQAQVRSEGGWSRWFSLGRREGGFFRSPDRQEDESGFVDIDTLVLRKKASALRYRFLFSAKKRPVRLRLAAVAVSAAAAPAAPAAFLEGPWVRELKARPRSQMQEQEKYKNDICSPTALAMAIDYWGVRLKTLKAAKLVRDETTGKYGVWPFNTAAAAGLGLEAYVARLGSLEDLQAEIAEGRPAVVSVSFDAGELSGAPLEKTKGHLMLVSGFTPDGNVIALDPAAQDKKTARRVYDRAQFHRAWRVNKRGLAYLLGKPLRRKMAVGVPVVDLLAAARPHQGLNLSDPNHLSQLLYGEAATVLAAKGNWVKIAADEQQDFLVGRRWQGYPGWVRAESLRATPGPRANVVVRTRQALLHIGDEILALSVGTKLARVSEEKGMSRVRLLDGRLAEISSDSLYAPSSNPDEDRHQIVKTAELFLGTSYYWGGRSGVQQDLSIGVDCSGLASLAYRIHGIDIPRDSHEQKLRSRPVSNRELKPGDLIFLTNSARSKRVTHVIIYTGGDGIIESRQSAGRTLRSSFTERFGAPLTEIASGSIVADCSFQKPRRRRIHFGSYL